MTLKEIFLPWAVIKDLRQDLRNIIQEHATQRSTITQMRYDMQPMKVRIAMQKVEINRLNAIIAKQPDRHPNGRFKAKKEA